jgi:hypothetical protein
VFRVCVATSHHLALVLEAVGQLERELELVRGYADARSYALGDPLADIRRVLACATGTVGILRDRLLSSELSLEGQAAGLRARSTTILMQLVELVRAEPEVASRLWPALGRFQSVRDVSAYLVDRLTKIDTTWWTDYRAIGRERSTRAEIRRREYQRAFVLADEAITSIGRDADLACFLAAGAAVSSRSFSTACRVLAALLDVPLASRTTDSDRAEIQEVQ